jgi:fibronectin-binding autotransporter adhesin
LNLRRAETPFRIAQIAFVTLVAVLSWAAPRAQGQVIQLNQSFTGTTAPGWVMGGSGYSPVLTANQGASPGWLEMTNGATNESTYAYDTTSFASANATISATFNYVSFNGTGADGLTFFLADASVIQSQGFTPGAYGGSLGYAQKTLAGGGGSNINGLAGGYLGIGIDEYGNYSNPTEGRVGGTGFVSNAIAVRGPGSGLSGYNYLGGTGSLATPLSYPGQTTMPTGSQAETIQMVLTSTNQLTVSVEFGNSGVFVTEFTANLSGYTRPQNLVLGFTAGTGSLTSTQEIQNVNLSAVTANIWTNTRTDSNWNTANDWLSNPAQVPTTGSDVLLNNQVVNAAQTINVGSNQILRSLQIDAPFTYTLNNGSFEFNTEGVPGNSGIIVSSINGTATQTINSNLIADNAIIIQNNTLSALNLNGTINTTGNSGPGANPVNFNGSGVVNVTGVVSGNGSIAQTGTGTTTLSGNNTYSGGTVLSAGTLVANNANALGTGSVGLYGGTLSSTNSSSISNGINLYGNATMSGLTSSGALTQNGGSYTLVLSNATQSGAVNLSNNNTAQTLTAEVDSGTSTVSGVIANGGTGAGGLTKTGNGTLVLGAANAYTGATTVNGGTLQLGAANAINALSAVSLNNATLNLNGYSDQVGALSFNNGTINFGSGSPTNTLTINSFSSGTGVLTINGWTSGSTTFQAVNNQIGNAILNQVYFAGVGSGAAETSSGGYYLITPNNVFLTWTGADSTTPNNNSLWGANIAGTTNWVAGVPSKAANSTQKLDFTGTTGLTPTMDASYYVNAVKFDTAAGAFTITQAGNTLYLDGNVPSIIQQSGSAQVISGGTVNWASNGVVDVSGAGSLTVSSVMTGSGGFTKLGTGTLVLSGANTSYSGAIGVNAGVLDVANTNRALGTGAVTVNAGGALEGSGASTTLNNNLSLAGSGSGGTGGAGAVDAEMNSGSTLTLRGTVTLAGDTTLNSGSGSTLAVSNSISGTNTNLTLTGAGSTTLNGLATGTGSLTLNGSGTRTLSGTFSDTGERRSTRAPSISATRAPPARPPWRAT